MKNKKGFVFIETIIVITVLSAGLLAIYSSYTSAITKEQKRTYYDDAAYIYRSYYIGNYILENTRLKDFINAYLYKTSDGDNVNNKSLLLILGTESNITGGENLFNQDTNKNEFSKMAKYYHLNQLLILKPDYTVLTSCTNKVLNNTCTNSTSCTLCHNTFLESGIDTNLQSYIKTLGNQKKSNYLFIMDYKESYNGTTCNETDTGCKNVDYYVWLDSGIKYE
jgi:Tfp pilus assembly protein PilE